MREFDVSCLTKDLFRLFCRKKFKWLREREGVGLRVVFASYLNVETRTRRISGNTVRSGQVARRWSYRLS